MRRFIRAATVAAHALSVLVCLAYLVGLLLGLEWAGGWRLALAATLMLTLGNSVRLDKAEELEQRKELGGDSDEA